MTIIDDLHYLRFHKSEYLFVWQLNSIFLHSSSSSDPSDCNTIIKHTSKFFVSGRQAMLEQQKQASQQSLANPRSPKTDLFASIRRYYA